ncbi:MAG: peroxiredoxin family protein [Planctomycetota bacterium]|jgi:peroxiredoxin
MNRGFLAAAVLAAGLFFGASLTAGEGYNAGDTCPDFTLFDTHGKLVKLSDFRGKVVLLHLLATW